MDMTDYSRSSLTLALSVAFVFFLSFCVPCMARGGGGCIEKGTKIRTPCGMVPIENIRSGDKITALINGRFQEASVAGCITVQSAEFVEIILSNRIVSVTAEHPVAVDKGVFRMAGYLKAGDQVISWDEGVKSEPVLSVNRKSKSNSAYNLMVSPGGTYVAGRIVVHNKGCFLPETPILRPDGSVTLISMLKKGDRVMAFTLEGKLVSAEIRNITKRTVGEYFVVSTGKVRLNVTGEHPFYVGDGTFMTLESLCVGGNIFAHDGKGISEQPITGIEKIVVSTTVYNLQTDEPNTFFADGVAVHNKGGGCFLPETPVLLADRTSVPINRIKHGDRVMAFRQDGTVTEAGVEKVMVQMEDEYFVITTEDSVLKVTGEHPFFIGNGCFKAAASLRVGETLYGFIDGVLARQSVLAMEKVLEEVSVYNLQTDTPNTFFAGGIAVHNKGCFPAGTMIETPEGPKCVEKLVPGDMVISPKMNGCIVTSSVQSVFLAEAPLVIVRTDLGELRTTEEHPIALSDGTFLPAGNLSKGDRVLMSRCGVSFEAEVRSIEVMDSFVPVYNLRVTEPHAYIADGYIVHNKGGGGRSHSSGSGSSKPLSAAEQEQCNKIALVIFMIGIGVVIVIGIFRKAKNRLENLDYCYSRSKIGRKAVKTEKLLKFIANQDPMFEPVLLRKIVETIFVQLQECWKSRQYDPMQNCMMSYLYRQHLSQINAMIRSHEINKLEGLHVEAIDLVNVRYTNKDLKREFTALITATARDTYIDDRSGEFLRGDDKPAQFQEFWTFQLQQGQWKLREIEQTRESDVLKDENFFEQFTDKQLEQVYGEVVDKTGPAGPWLKGAEAERATKIERMLNFLAETDKLWDRQQMMDRARQVFADVYLGRQESVLPATVKECLFPDVAQHLETEMAGLKAKGLAVEYRNFCVRKVEIVLVYNFADNAKDEFCARINAHAQKTVRRGEAIFSQDDDVEPIEEFWVFGRLDGQWKLNEVLPSVTSAKISKIENLDEDSNPDQVQWYYTKKRTV